MGIIDLLPLDNAFLRNLLVLVAAYQCVVAVYGLFFSPLSAVPGPWYAGLSNAWLLFYAARGLKCNKLHQLFDQYGPIVRVGPKRVVFRDWDTMKSVYCFLKLPKSRSYQDLLADNHDHAMTSLSESEHALRRRTFASHYSPLHILRFQSDIRECIMHLVEVLDESAPRTVDCIHALRHALVDVIMITVFGLRPRAVDNFAAQVRDPICAAVRDIPIRLVVRSAISKVIWPFLGYLPHTRWLELYSSDDILATFVRKRLNEFLQEAQAENTESLECNDHVALGSEDRPAPLMAQMIAQRIAGSPAHLSDQDIVSECFAHLVAGVDTSTTTLGFMLWELSRRPDVVQKLRAELDEIMPDRRTIADFATLVKQPYLTAFLNEGFRLYGSVSALLQRVVSSREKSKVDDAPFKILGFSLPEGTVVGMQAWSFHRDPSVFPNPEYFDPERWFPSPRDNGTASYAAEDERLHRMMQHMLPFGAGTRICPGRHQAQIVFRITIAAIVLNFDLAADPAETNEQTMAPRDRFVVRPAARECKLKFTPRLG